MKIYFVYRLTSRGQSLYKTDYNEEIQATFIYIHLCIYFFYTFAVMLSYDAAS